MPSIYESLGVCVCAHICACVHCVYICANASHICGHTMCRCMCLCAQRSEGTLCADVCAYVLKGQRAHYVQICLLMYSEARGLPQSLFTFSLVRASHPTQHSPVLLVQLPRWLWGLLGLCIPSAGITGGQPCQAVVRLVLGIQSTGAFCSKCFSH